MSRNGTGTYSLPAGNPVVTGTTISSTWANNTLTDIATALTGSLAADGQTTATGNLQMGNNRVTGLADGIASTDAATVSQVTTAGATYLLKASNLSDVANATTSRGNLVAAKSGANSDITSLTGLTTPLTVAQGGTGAATLTSNNVLLGNGTSAPQFVAPSTSGNVLTSNGTTWVSSAPTSGKILQVKNATDGTQVTTSSSSFQTTGFSLSITPSSTNSKILAIMTANAYVNPATNYMYVTLYRGATNLGDASYGFGDIYGNSGDRTGQISCSYLDSPSSTSSVTYTIYFRATGGTAYYNIQSTLSTLTLMEIAA